MGVQATRQHRTRNPGKHIARSRRRQPGGSQRGKRGATVGRGDDGIGALEDDRRSGGACGIARAVELATRAFAEQTVELAGMGG